jgi:hypothetical protein
MIDETAGLEPPTSDDRLIWDWNYPEVADSFTLRHRNLLHCSLLVSSRARVV